MPTFSTTAGTFLTRALRHKLWVDDVVSSLVRLHYVEAAAAPAVERPLEPKLDINQSHLYQNIFLTNIQHATVIQAAFGAGPLLLYPWKVALRCQQAARLGSCLKRSHSVMPVKDNAQIQDFGTHKVSSNHF